MEGFNELSTRNSDEKLLYKALGVSERELHKPWKPWTLNSGTLISTAVFSVGLAGVPGILQWENARHGALFFASTTDGFSFTENFLYRYFPTIIIVLYGMAFSWIDLDIKRLEPWFQLARNGGAEAEKSVLLQYPVDFLPFVPFKAAKLWLVMLLSLINRKLTTFLQANGQSLAPQRSCFFVSWGLTPLQ